MGFAVVWWYGSMVVCICGRFRLPNFALPSQLECTPPADAAGCGATGPTECRIFVAGLAGGAEVPTTCEQARHSQSIHSTRTTAQTHQPLT